MNEYRGGAPLVWNDCLADLARAHSEDMMTRGYFGHGTSGDSSSFLISARAEAAGFTPSVGWLDEDVYTGDLHYVLFDDIRGVVDAWMTDGHAIPILGCDEAGVGVAEMDFLDTVIVWVTADFVCP
jgi:uncharacterized protein YkwD